MSVEIDTKWDSMDSAFYKCRSIVAKRRVGQGAEGEGPGERGGRKRESAIKLNGRSQEHATFTHRVHLNMCVTPSRVFS